MHSVFEVIDEDPASAGPDLISLDDLKLVLGISGSASDVELQAAITFQSRIIAEYCDRRFGRADAIETFTFDRGEALLARQALVLKLYPVTNIVSVEGSLFGLTSDYEFDPVSGRLWLSNTIPMVWRASYGPFVGKIAVTYSGGYDLPEESPARLSRAVIETVAEARKGATRELPLQEVQHTDTRVRYFPSTLWSASSGYLSGSVQDLIAAYRRLTVA